MTAVAREEVEGQGEMQWGRRGLDRLVCFENGREGKEWLLLLLL